MTKYEDVKNITTEQYFGGNKFSRDAFEKKYAAYKGETYVNALKRVVDYVASVEKTEQLRKYWSERWFDEIYNDWWHPAGSIMQGAGSGRKISLANCTTISLGSINNGEEWDNLESIFKNTAYTVAKTAAYRQGLGVDFSALRPRGATVLNSSNESTGAVHWMSFIDTIAQYVGQKGRIPAFLFSISCKHPDIEEFIKCKEQRLKIQNANISVQCTEDFYKAVEEDKDWILTFEIPEVKKGDKIYFDIHSIDKDCILEKETGRYYKIATHDRPKEVFEKKVKARELMELIAKQMHANAEPGIQNIDIARKYSNSDALYDPNDEYDSRIISTNACSEQYLSRESLCVLSSINMGKFSTKREEYIKELETIGKSINRFLDNVNECELRYHTYATPHQKLAIEKLRRTGAGITNMAAWLFKQNLSYGSKEGNDAVEEFVKIYNYWLYVSTEELGKEKGNFGLFDSKKWKNANFVSRVIKLSKDLNKELGLPILTGNYARNVTVSSIAPTGCIEKNTRIITSKGLIKIKDIISESEYPKEKEFNHSVSNIRVYDEVTSVQVKSFYNNGTVNGYIVELEDGRIHKMSDTHRIRVLGDDGEYMWKYAPDLKEGDIVVLSKYNNFDVDVYQPLSFIPNESFPNQLNEDLAMLIGLISKKEFFADYQHGKLCVYYSQKDGIEILEKIKNLMNSLFKIPQENPVTFKKNILNIVEFFLNQDFFDFLSKNNLIDFNNFDRIPEKIYLSPKSVIRAYLHGLFSTRALSYNDTFTITCEKESISFLRDIQELLLYVGINSRVEIMNKVSLNKTECRISITYVDDIKKYIKEIGTSSSLKLQTLNKMSTKNDYEKMFFSKKQALKCREYLYNLFGSGNNLCRNFAIRISKNEKNGVTYVDRDMLYEIRKHVPIEFPFELERMFFSKIKKITRSEIETCDIEVDNNKHTYVTGNGIINHNTLSLMFRDSVLSYGIEPPFFIYYWKRTRIDGDRKYTYYFNVPRIVRDVFKERGWELPMNSDSIKDDWEGTKGKEIAKYIEAHKNELNFKESIDINPKDKLELMSRVMKWIDSSISTTYILPENSSWKDVYDFIMESHKKEVKSLAAFPDKKMYGIVSKIPFKELATKLINEGLNIHQSNFSDEELAALNLPKYSSEPLFTVKIPKRFPTLEADIYTITVRGEKFVIVVGIQEGKPYEIFGGKVNGFNFKFSYKKGKITKVKKGQYALEFDDINIDDFSKHFTPTEQILFRMTSMLLRHGVPIQYIVDQLYKATEDITSMAAAAARVLKKYIKNGEVIKQPCPSCGGSMVYMDGCTTCISCSYSKCM